jgi:hypothetical protein
MKRVNYYFLVLISCFILNTTSNAKPYPPINKSFTVVNSNFTQADIESDNLISKGKIYARSDAFELRKNLEDQLQNNPNSIPLSLALVKFHCAASATNGGFMGSALRYATNIFKIDEYMGCLAFEYIYTKYGDIKNAEVWYKNSTRCHLPAGMEWRIVKINLNPPLGASVMGNFSNGKKWPMYQTIWSSYIRRIMVPKCAGECNFTVLSNFLNEEKVVEGKLARQDW